MTIQTNHTAVGGNQPDKLCPKCALIMAIRAVSGNFVTGESTTEWACPNCAYSESSTAFDDRQWWNWWVSREV